jgi:IrrE N-terminal-like domain
MPSIGASSPGEIFLRHRRSMTAAELIRDYAYFLLKSSDAYRLPIKVDRVRKHFDLPSVRMAGSLGQRGLTTEDLQIYLNADDRPTVQKFTFAHELMEVFFYALDAGAADSWMSDALFVELKERKERFCEFGAAELVMPMELFKHLVPTPMRFAWALHLAEFCELSLTATLWRVLETGRVPAVLVIWRHAHAPREVAPPVAGQLALLSGLEEMGPAKKMRVIRAITPPSFKGFIPPHKSIPDDSVIRQCYLEGTAMSGIEDLDLRDLQGRFLVEAIPFQARGERHVISLVHLDTEGTLESNFSSLNAS